MSYLLLSIVKVNDNAYRDAGHRGTRQLQEYLTEENLWLRSA